jgi:hypothetical protein
MDRWKKRMLAVVCVGVVLGPLRIVLAVGREDPTARLRYLGARLEAHDGPGLAPGAPFDGEWWLVEHSFTIAAATNLAFRQPSEASRRREDIARWLELMLTLEVRAFDTARWKEDAFTALDGNHGHIGVLGHVGWAMGASCLVGNPPHALVPPLAEGLSRRLRRAEDSLLETYPGEVYVPDNLVAVAALALLRRCEGQGDDPEVRRFLARLDRFHRDPVNGLFVFSPGQPARGSGAAWTAYFLTFVDPALARDQFDRLFDGFGAFGGLAVREWPVGVDRPGDVDSGPLVFGLSASATGFAMAGPALGNDEGVARKLRLTAETVGVSWGGRFLFAPLVGDAIVLATSTATPWTDVFLSPPSARR